MTMLDVGCGVGHWGRVLAPFLAPGAAVTGVDREPNWVTEAAGRAPQDGRVYRYLQGDAVALPVENGSFDIVTCQTVLIHLKDPRAAIAEMLRAVRPGGLVVLVEPNNLCSALALDSRSVGKPVEDLMALVRFQLICERGKEALGEGNNSIGGLVPCMLASAGAEDVQVCLSDRVYAYLPPYKTRDEQSIRAEIIGCANKDFWIWDRTDTRKYFLAGGGSDAEFESLWAKALADLRAQAAAFTAGTVSGAQGAASYITWGRRSQ